MKPKLDIRLLSDHLLVYPIQATRLATNDIILLAATDPNAPIDGIVIGVGEGKKDKDGNLVPPSYEYKDRITFIKSEARVITIDDDKFFVIRSKDVLCKHDNHL